MLTSWRGCGRSEVIEADFDDSFTFSSRFAGLWGPSRGYRLFRPLAFWALNRPTIGEKHAENGAQNWTDVWTICFLILGPVLGPFQEPFWG